MSKAKRKGDLIKVARQLNLSTGGTIQELKDRLQRYHTSLKANYERKNIQSEEIHFWNVQTQPSFKSMLCHDKDVIYAARNDTKVITSFQVKKDGVGLRGVSLQEFKKYGNSWRKIYSICLCGGNIFLSHCEGICKVSLESVESTNILQMTNHPCFMTALGSEVLFANQMKSSVWKITVRGEARINFCWCRK